ncbi:hypothetical protein [Methyloceanibacter caenitepidi]|uniref:Glycosyltransferase n=1 Tax=Methyloceanibacter caenitepidi TaxID=1384459 RepID=A0A0A8JZ73_9HYPH|nr:hypothetical protein [Methyloceanibacter caenitepidi]BAQ15721.1 hypothetical protein GL4_0251 [Methyloceanibacter caenitepidi]
MVTDEAGGAGPTAVFDVSGHGFGHLGQVAPIVQALRARHPSCRIVVRTALTAAVVRDFVGSRIELAPPPTEATMVMHGPTAVDPSASAEAHRRLCDNWDTHVEREAARLAALAPAVLVSDVSYLSIAAAKRLGLPAIGLSSINWGDIYRTYCGAAPDAEAVLKTIGGAYRSADLFLQVQPHMPMTDLSNRRSIGPVARVGRDRRGEIDAALGVPSHRKLVLVTLGGIPGGDPLILPPLEGIHWLAGAGVSGPADGTNDVRSLGLPFADVLASADAVIGKVGYATFVEAACNGTALISAPRDDWPESPFLLSWAAANARFALTPSGFGEQALRAALDAVFREPAMPAARASGIEDACDIIADAGGLS